MRCRDTLYACCLLLAIADAQRWTPECGTSVARGRPTIVNGALAEYGAFPWHVGVYKRNSTGCYEQTCGGTLISPDLVISAAHCFYDEPNGTLRNTTEFVIAAGKYYRPYHWPEYYVQRSCVESIDIPSNYIGYGGNYAADIALVRVETPFNITELIKPVCVDWDSIYENEHFQKGHIGKTVGWGLTETKAYSYVLREINLPFVPYEDCWSAVPTDFRGFITPQDKFCAGYLNGSSVCSGDSGGGLCFESNGVWYLRGVVSTIPLQADSDLPCDYNQYAAFTNVGSFLRWIRSAYNGVGIATDGCILPEQPAGGSYQVSCRGGKCDTGNEPGSVIPTKSILVYRCQEGYILKGSTASTCQISGWSSLPACIKICPPLASNDENWVCKYEGKPVSCDSPIEPGTTAYLSCETFYKISGTLNSTDETITCRDGGEWDRPTPRCIPVCGGTPDPDSLMDYDEDGNLIQHARFPWNVFVTFNPKDETGAAGTLIQPDVVVLGFNEFFIRDGDGHSRDINNFTVNAGIYYNFNMTKRGYLYMLKVESLNYVKMNPGIVLLRLVRPFNLTTWIRPVCIDWNDRLTAEQLRKGNIGKVPIGLLEIEGTDERQSAADLAFVPREDCISMIKEEYRDLFRAPDLFCANNSTNSSHLLQFDSSTVRKLLFGIGIYFETNDVWYLRGITRANIRSQFLVSSPNVIYVVYGNVGHYLEWIRTVYGDAWVGSRGPGGCILPEPIKDGKFELTLCKGACNNETGSRVPVGSVIVHRCNQSAGQYYSLEGKGASTCSANGWDSLPICVKQCPPLVITGVAKVCKRGGETVSCDSPLPPGASASLSCGPFYKTLDTQNSTDDEITCLDEGEWSRPTLQCIPECGRAPDPKSLFTYDIDGKPFQHMRFPWDVLIYVVKSVERSEEDFIGGTLIQPGLVISVNKVGFYSDDDGHQRDVKNFVIFAGAGYDWVTVRAFGQFSFIKSFNITNGSLVNAPVLIRTAKPLEMTTEVRPICIDWDDRLTAEQLRKGNIGRISTFRLEADSSGSAVAWRTGEADLAYIPREDCVSMIREEFRKLYTSTEFFCAQNSTDSRRSVQLNSSAVNQLDSAIGFYFESEGVWYLRGVVNGIIPVSHVPPSSSNTTYLRFTTVGNYLEWIRADHDDAGIDTRGISNCILPEQLDERTSKLRSCEGACSTEPGSRVPIDSIIFHTCNLGYNLNGKRESTCGANGWDSLPNCVKCGRALNPVSLFHYSDNGDLIQRNRFPWQVVIGYFKSPGEDGWTQIDGTLVQPDLVITTNQGGFFVADDGHLIDHQDTHVYAGYHYQFNDTSRKYNYHDKSLIEVLEYGKVSSIEEIILVRLARPFEMTVWIRPICIDPYSEVTAKYLGKGDIGKIPINLLKIEGTDERKTAADLVYIPREDCVSMIKEEFRNLYTAKELFCAHNSTNSSRSLQLDSSTANQLHAGIGFYSESEGVWYLRGVSYGVIPISHVLPSSPNITYMRFVNVDNFVGRGPATRRHYS